MKLHKSGILIVALILLGSLAGCSSHPSPPAPGSWGIAKGEGPKNHSQGITHARQEAIKSCSSVGKQAEFDNSSATCGNYVHIKGSEKCTREFSEISSIADNCIQVSEQSYFPCSIKFTCK